MLRAVRRIVTGHDAEGKYVVLSDAPSPPALEYQDQEGHGLTAPAPAFAASALGRSAPAATCATRSFLFTSRPLSSE